MWSYLQRPIEPLVCHKHYKGKYLDKFGTETECALRVCLLVGCKMAKSVRWLVRICPLRDRESQHTSHESLNRRVKRSTTHLPPASLWWWFYLSGVNSSKNVSGRFRGRKQLEKKKHSSYRKILWNMGACRSCVCVRVQTLVADPR